MPTSAQSGAAQLVTSSCPCVERNCDGQKKQTHAEGVIVPECLAFCYDDRKVAIAFDEEFRKEATHTVSTAAYSYLIIAI